MTFTEANGGSLEPTIPPRIGAGSFAAIYAPPGRPIVFKVPHAPEDAPVVRREFNSLHVLYTECNTDPFFALPRPLAFYDPATNDVLFFPRYFERGRRSAPRRPFHAEFFASLPGPGPRACYVMDRVPPLPHPVGDVVRANFYSERAVAARTPLPLLCRLYFGKERIYPSAFVNPNNFPLDAARYDTLLHAWKAKAGGDGDGDLPTKEDVAAGMGEMLSRIHWIAGYDARDVEFVMAGAPDSAEVRFHLIDFNQVRVSFLPSVYNS